MKQAISGGSIHLDPREANLDNEALKLIIALVLKIDPDEGKRLVQGKHENATSASLIRAFRYLSRVD